MLTTFCLRLACGMIGSLALLSSKEVNPRFFRTQYLVALGIIAVAAMASDSHHLGGFWLDLGGAALLACLGSIIWSLAGNPWNWLIWAATTLTLLAALTSRSIAITRIQEPRLLGFDALLGDLTSAALLGTAVTAMLLGHSYLIAPGMSLTPLMRLLTALFVATGLRMILAGWGLWSWTAGHSLVNWEDETVLWFPVRWGLGFAGPLVLGWMARSAAKIRSTQSATGILYVVVIFAFLGELTSQLLLANTGYML